MGIQEDVNIGDKNDDVDSCTDAANTEITTDQRLHEVSSGSTPVVSHLSFDSPHQPFNPKETPFEAGSTFSISEDNDAANPIICGVCAMGKKVQSKPMKEVLGRISIFSNIQVVIFEEKVILNEPVTKWPLCDALISFYSEGFPIDKAIEYAKLRKPYLVNELEAQYRLMDRVLIYKALMEHDIPVPKHAVVRRDKDGNFIGEPPIIHENDDAIEVDGVIITKPFVEKPIDAENHNINIYFPQSAGGGCVFLFRKTNNRSSCYMKEVNKVRKTGSYIYEEFMPTDGTDVKVYTVGKDYAHAEARKSPCLDGRVERDAEGKEIRYPVILTPWEKTLAKKVCMVSQQQVCGFDLLRANGMSYVCDVNGFSFVKTSKKYYEDCGHILSMIITRAVRPESPVHMKQPIVDTPLVPTTAGSIMELRTVIAVIRHGDRTPKQKLKMETKHPSIFAIFRKYNGYESGHLKLKKPKELQELLDICRKLLEEMEVEKSERVEEKDQELEDKREKFQQLRSMLELYGHFSGLNRKVQFKLQNQNPDGEDSLLMVAKWGGELTDLGRRQAQNLGRAFRQLYPEGDGNFEGVGLLRLHSTYRHDLKIYASEEGRVQMTAAAFAKGFLALEGELTPILAQMVKSANTNGLLDCDNECRKDKEKVKKRIRDVLSKDAQFSEEDFQTLAPNGERSLLISMKVIMNPFRLCQWLVDLMGKLVTDIKRKRRRKPRPALYHHESWELFQLRWRKLQQDFLRRDGTFDISKLPDIYDNIKYDLLHNRKVMDIERFKILYEYAKHLADVVVPQEYGITREEKLLIGQRICRPLMRKVLSDARYTDTEDCLTRLNSQYSRDVHSPHRFVRTRLYFTSESHIHALLTCIRFGGLVNPVDPQWQRAMEYVDAVPELNYMTQIVIMIYEDPEKISNENEKFHVELHFSPGSYTDLSDLPKGKGYRPKTSEKVSNACLCQSPTSDQLSESLEDLRLDQMMRFETTVDADFLKEEEDVLPGDLTPDLWKINLEELSNKEMVRRTSVDSDCLHHKRSEHLISTAVITGAPFSLHLPTERVVVKDAHDSSQDSLVPLAPSVPDINPLETLHNALTLSQLENFLEQLISGELTTNHRERKTTDENRSQLVHEEDCPYG